ncbi:hypothetical protein RAS1_29580 [Phycisphaerae bacterium RAS1]|nr:hypothetical protein RAS1_29580 [Phycisphaerae bacterium RAS1]
MNDSAEKPDEISAQERLFWTPLTRPWPIGADILETRKLANIRIFEPWQLAVLVCEASSQGDEFFRQIGMQVSRADKSHTTFPNEREVVEVRTEADVVEFAHGVASHPTLERTDLGDLVHYLVREIGRNVVQHSSSPIGAACAAKLDAGFLRIAVCDTGRGVRNSIGALYPEIATDLEALRLSVLPHTSGARPSGPYAQSENLGLGLFFSKEMCWRAGGGFCVASGEGMLVWVASESNGPERYFKQIRNWAGTLVSLTLPATTVTTLEDLLEVCHALAREVQREPSTVGLDFIDGAAEFPSDALRLQIAPVQDSLQQTHELRHTKLLPAVQQGDQVVLDFADVRFLATSIAQALLGEVFKIRGSLTRLTFLNCSRPTKLAIQTVAGAARATYNPRFV